MKRLFLLGLLMLSAVIGRAQLIKSQSATADDFIPLLESKGYNVFSFDITPLAEENATFSFEPVIKHYVGGKEVDDVHNFGITFTNREMLSRYSAEKQAEMLADGKAYDAEKGIAELHEKLLVSFSPLENKFGRVMSFKVGKFGLDLQLTFKEVFDQNGNPNTSFGVRPFKIDNIKVGEYHPLALLGTYWWDENTHLFRFCGEDILSPDMSDDIIKFIPEFYVIGTIIRKY